MPHPRAPFVPVAVVPHCTPSKPSDDLSLSRVSHSLNTNSGGADFMSSTLMQRHTDTQISNDKNARRTDKSNEVQPILSEGPRQSSSTTLNKPTRSINSSSSDEEDMSMSPPLENNSSASPPIKQERLPTPGLPPALLPTRPEKVPDIQVKRERSPSPSVIPDQARRQVSSGTVWIHPVPENCQMNAQPDWQQLRRAWARERGEAWKARHRHLRVVNPILRWVHCQLHAKFVLTCVQS